MLGLTERPRLAGDNLPLMSVFRLAGGKPTNTFQNLARRLPAENCLGQHRGG